MPGQTGYSIDLAAAVKAHKPSQAAIGDRMLDERQRRSTFKTAVLLAPLSER